MTGPQQPATVSSSCPSCGAGMGLDPGGRVLRCPYCQHEVLIPASQPSPPNSPFGADQAGPPHITVTTKSVPPTVSPEDAKKAQRGMWIVAAIVVAPLAIVIATNIFRSDTKDEGPKKPVEVAVGETARVQSFEATVHSVNCDKQSITKPNDPVTDVEDSVVEKAQGKFCVVSISVKNIGTKTERFETSALEAKSPTERILEHGSIAESYINNDKYLVSSPLDEPIDPGKVVDRLLVYDVPVDTTLARLRIFWDLFSDTTVTVKVA